ncbi:MAG: hypothetical protein ACR2QB_07720 [Gammaproteobacteria bacterium]
MFFGGSGSFRPLSAHLVFLCLIAGLLSALAGCAGKVGDEPEVARLSPGDDPAMALAWTSRTAVKESLGEPVRTYLNGQVWVYEEVFQGRWLSDLPIVVADPEPAAEPGAATYASDTPVFRIFEFDSDGALISQRRVVGDKRCQDGVCISLGLPDQSIPLPFMSAYTGAFTVDAPEWWVQSLADKPSADGCSLYLYDTRRVRSSGARIWLDGAPAGWLLSQDSYQRWELPTGQHELYVRSRWDAALRKVQCAAGELIYLRFRSKDNGSLDVIEPAKARKKLAKRQLVLSDWPRGPLRPGIGTAPDMRLSWLKPGVTTQTDLEQRLGPPDLRLKRPTLLVYATGAPRWAQITGLELGDVRFNDLYMLVARFDGAGRLLRSEVVLANPLHAEQLRMGDMEGAEETRSLGTSNFLQCTEYGVCFGYDGLAARFASTPVELSAQDYVTKVRSPPSGTCVAYLWSDEVAGKFRVSLDGVPQGYLHNRHWPDGVFIWELADGISELKVDWLNAPGGSRTRTQSLECTAGKALRIALAKRDDQLQIDIKRSLRPPRVPVSERRYLPSAAGKFPEYQAEFPRL